MKVKIHQLIIVFICMVFIQSCHVQKTAISESLDMIIENDVVIPMRDSGQLLANIYRPRKKGKYPVIMSLGPYDKDNLPYEYDPEASQ